MKTAQSLLALLAACAWNANAQGQGSNWRDKVRQQLPLLGHRNWILVVDSAYPLQVSAGVETVETGADQLTVLKEVMQAISATKHVRPILFEDRELAFVPERDAPGVERYRSGLNAMVGRQRVELLPHEQIIGKIDEAGRTFRVLVLKTTLAIPYTSVFLQLDCRYWSAEAESKLRKAMKAAPQ